MIAHDSTFESLAKAPVKQSNVIVARQVLGDTGYTDDTLKYTSGDFLMQVNIDSVGQILGQATKKCTVKLLGIKPDAQAGDFFQVRLGLYNQDPSVSGFNYISQGFYTVDNVAFDYDSGYTTITLYDAMWTAAKRGYATTVPTSAITYPISVKNFATYICGLLGLNLDSNFANLPNSSFMIASDLYTTQSGTTLQTAIQDIAGATGTTARISDNTLVFSQYNVSSENLTSNELKTLKIGDTYGPITSVILGRQPQNDNIALYASTPTNLIVSNVNTSTDVFTITDSGMATGNMVYFQTTGTLPAPLVAGKNYYTYMVSGDDTFKLSDTYLHAIAGTNFIDITTAGTGTLAIQPIITKEIQINNNEILDNDRQTLLPPLYNTLSGIDWSDVKADTVGLGWHEVGDVIKFTQGLTTKRAFISEVHLVLAGSIKESLVSSIPDVASIDYKAAGGIAKTLNNTEIKVDKQNQTITSIVDQQTTLNNQVTRDFTQIYQNLANILLTVQKSGGGNLILNSVGFAVEKAADLDNVTFDKLAFWYYNHNNSYPFPTDGSQDTHSNYKIATHGSLTAYSSSESQNAGGISGQVIDITGNGLILEQYMTVAAKTPLSFGLRVKSPAGSGGGTVTLYNSVDTFTINIDNSTNYNWQELKIENFVSSTSWLKVKVQSNSANHLQITDLRLLYGETLQGWVQAAAEILSTNVQFSKIGMKIFDNLHDTETQVTYNEFSTRRRSDGTVLFEADDAGVVTQDLVIKGNVGIQIGETPAFKQLTIPNTSSRGGIAFIRVSS